jgi:hypothetical protein
MSIEIGVHFAARPDPDLIERLVGPLMSALLGDQIVAAWVEESADSWTVSWGGSASAIVVFVSSEFHEFADGWFANVAPGERGMELSLMLAELVVILIATVCDGQIIDELALLGGKPAAGGQLLVKMLDNRNTSAAEIIAALRAF